MALIKIRNFFLSFFIIACSKNKEISPQKPIVDRNFQLLFGEPSSPEDRRVMKLVETRMRSVVDALNQRVVLPVDIPIVFTSSKVREGPAYSGTYANGVTAEGVKGRLIVYPYLMLRTIEKTLGTTKLSGKELEDAIADTAVFILVHEASHALIDVLSLPILGPEEDAADCGATIFLTSLEEGAKTIQHAILFWRAFAKIRGLHSDAFADIHGLDLQRAYNLACWTYGQDIALNDIFEKELPKHRAKRCAAEYARLANSWDRVLMRNLR